jgi:phosphoserine phosphatase RsbU/P
VPRRSTVFAIPAGALLCSYTDGLVERRDESLDVGIGLLATTLGGTLARAGAISGAEASLAEAACAAVMRALVGHTPASDDVAVLMLHRR